MPIVGKKHFPYSKKGKAMAKKEEMMEKVPLPRTQKRAAKRKS